MFKITAWISFLDLSVEVSYGSIFDQRTSWRCAFVWCGYYCPSIFFRTIDLDHHAGSGKCNVSLDQFLDCRLHINKIVLERALEDTWAMFSVNMSLLTLSLPLPFTVKRFLSLSVRSCKTFSITCERLSVGIKRHDLRLCQTVSHGRLLLCMSIDWHKRETLRRYVVYLLLCMSTL